MDGENETVVTVETGSGENTETTNTATTVGDATVVAAEAAVALAEGQAAATQLRAEDEIRGLIRGFEEWRDGVSSQIQTLVDNQAMLEQNQASLLAEITELRSFTPATSTPLETETTAGQTETPVAEVETSAGPVEVVVKDEGEGNPVAQIRPRRRWI